MNDLRSRTEEERAYYDLSRRVYSKFAPFYDIVVRPIEGLRRTVARLAGIGPGSKVLDVATGTGAQARAFAATGAEIVGIDLSEEMLRVARRKSRRSNPSYVHADATALPFEDGSFDVASVSFALHEMPRSIRESVLREMRRVVVPGGTLVVVDYALPQHSAWGPLVSRVIELFEAKQYAEFVRSDVREMLEGCGIGVRQEQPALLGAARIVIGFDKGGAPQPR
jgi:demethylmenaquinone methyltransferase/2-methoxy-6-polyprenyl-1,4-benzoquinol methylase